MVRTLVPQIICTCILLSVFFIFLGGAPLNISMLTCTMCVRMILISRHTYQGPALTMGPAKAHVLEIGRPASSLTKLLFLLTSNLENTSLVSASLCSVWQCCVLPDMLKKNDDTTMHAFRIVLALALVVARIAPTPLHMYPTPFPCACARALSLRLSFHTPENPIVHPCGLHSHHPCPVSLKVGVTTARRRPRYGATVQTSTLLE